MGAYLGVAAPSGPSKHRPTIRSSRKTDIAALAGVLERSGAGGDDTKGDATGVSMTGGGALTTGGATVGGGTTGVTGSATGFTGASTGATAAGAGTPAAPPKQDKPNWYDIELTKTAAKNDGGKTRAEDNRDDDAGGVTRTVTRTGANNCRGATTVGGATTGASGAAGAEKANASDTESDYEKWDLCGLARDEKDWTEWQRPACDRYHRTTNSMRAECQNILDRIFAPDCAMQGVRVPFTYDEVHNVMDTAYHVLRGEPVLIEDVPNDIVVVADIHGQLFDLARIFTSYAKDGKPGWECRKFLFMGDYVDRGKQQLEVVMALFCMKILFPDSIFLLRGNHEFVQVNLKYGFAREINERYDDVAVKEMYFGINQIFCFLSIGAIIGNAYFCVHGGVSAQGLSRDILQAIYKPISYSLEHQLVHELTWADPAEGLEGACINAERHSSHFFGVDVLVAALQAIDCMVLIRGHTILSKGYEKQSNLVISLFSATNCLNKNDAAVADIDAKGHLTVRVFACSEARVKYEAEMAEFNGGKAQEDDAKTVADDGTGNLVQM